MKTYWFAILACIAAAPLCRAASDLEAFERNAARAKQLGATHMVITEDIPPALWEMDVPGDPYPAWYMYSPGLLKIFPPAALEKYVDKGYAERVAALFEARCQVLRRLGLKAAYHANEPHVLPEAFFAANPELRGPRVDHANRSRTARFAPCVDQPATLALYREAMAKLLRRLPEVEVFSFTTTDAGSGLCWTPALYPGLNGPSWCQRRPMEDRVAGFLTALHDAAGQMGRQISVDLVEIAPRQWMIPTFDHPELIARKLPAGMAVNHLEGPDGHRIAIRRFGGGAGEFAPVVGVPRPIATMRALMAGGRAPNSKLVVSMADPAGADLNFKVLEAFQKASPRNEPDLWTTLHGLASQTAGKDRADDLLSLWMATDEAERYLGTLNFGAVLTMGGILGRWVNRPLVPFPENLTTRREELLPPVPFPGQGRRAGGRPGGYPGHAHVRRLGRAPAGAEHHREGNRQPEPRRGAGPAPARGLQFAGRLGVAGPAAGRAPVPGGRRGRHGRVSGAARSREGPGWEARSQPGAGRAERLGPHRPDAPGAQ